MNLSLFFSRVRAWFARERARLEGAPTVNVWQHRQDEYRQWELMYANQLYRQAKAGGMLETIIRDVICPGYQVSEESAGSIVNHFNPIPGIVDAYQNVLRGQWGVDLRPADLVGKRQTNPKLVGSKDMPGPLDMLWARSNLDTSKELLQQMAANLGTVGLRVAAISDPDPRKCRVYLQLDHPGRIVDFETDARGNCLAVQLEYQALVGSAKDSHEVTVQELLTKESFMRQVDGKVEIDQENELGVCPYVILRHRDDGTPWGKPAHYSSVETIHAINWLITNHAESVYDHMYPTWFATASGNAPETIKIGKKSVSYVKTDPGSVNPTLDPLVPTLNQQAVTDFIAARKAEIKERQPEMILAGIEALANQSGETIARLLTPVEDRIRRARSMYEDALTRALQIGLSWGVMLNQWDLGTGMGSVEAADRAFQDGLEDFAFADRPALPMTSYDQAQQAIADTKRRSLDLADAVTMQQVGSNAEALRLMGRNEDDVQKILVERAKQDTIPTSGL